MDSSALIEWLSYVIGIGGMAGFLAYEFGSLQTYRDRKPLCWAVLTLTGPGAVARLTVTVRNRAPADLFVVGLASRDPTRLRFTGAGSADAGPLAADGSAPIDQRVAPCPPLASAFPTGVYELPCTFHGADLRPVGLRLTVRHPRAWRETTTLRLTARAARPDMQASPGGA